nr:LysR family transcriptional regulator [uncultured Dongia sp.]
MQRDELDSLALLLVVADEQSFTRAAAKLGISQSALSHSVSRLEQKLGVRLLTRTTRSIAPTEAGEQLLATLRPAIGEIRAKLAALSDFRERPAGTIRISTPEHAARTILWPVADRLTAANPDLHIELNVESGFSDIVTERFDAGVRLGERIEKDMIALRIGPMLRMAAVGSLSYFKRRGIPKTPHDLAQHSCINLRQTSSGGTYAWEFEKDGRELNVRVEGQLTFNRVSLMLDAAAAGHGIALVMEDQTAELLKSGALVRVLEDWCDAFDGYHLYYPSRRQPSVAFQLLVDALRYKG